METAFNGPLGEDRLRNNFPKFWQATTPECEFNTRFLVAREEAEPSNTVVREVFLDDLSPSLPSKLKTHFMGKTTMLGGKEIDNLHLLCLELDDIFPPTECHPALCKVKNREYQCVEGKPQHLCPCADNPVNKNKTKKYPPCGFTTGYNQHKWTCHIAKEGNAVNVNSSGKQQGVTYTNEARCNIRRHRHTPRVWRQIMGTLSDMKGLDPSNDTLAKWCSSRGISPECLGRSNAEDYYQFLQGIQDNSAPAA
jgi:hypothetical protein